MRIIEHVLLQADFDRWKVFCKQGRTLSLSAIWNQSFSENLCRGRLFFFGPVVKVRVYKRMIKIFDIKGDKIKFTHIFTYL